MKKPALLQDRKGVFYLLLVSILIGVLIVIFVAYKEYSFTDRQKVVETRIRTINDFIKSIDSDSERVIFISGFRALIAIEDSVARSGQYLSNTEEVFRMAFYNGTVNGITVEVLVNATYSDYLNKLRAIANRIGVDIDINVTNVSLSQKSPWVVDVVVTTRMNITDQRGVANWNFYRSYNASVSIISIRDPIYSVATLGKVPNSINVTPFTQFVDDDDPANLMTHVGNMSYTHNPLAPSFLMRLEGKFSNSTCCGIESFVYVPQLETQGLIINDSRSIVDYIYFSNDSNINSGYRNITCSVQNITGIAAYTAFKFKIDVNHTRSPSPDYLDGLDYTTC